MTGVVRFSGRGMYGWAPGTLNGVAFPCQVALTANFVEIEEVRRFDMFVDEHRIEQSYVGWFGGFFLFFCLYFIAFYPMKFNH